MRLLPLSKLDLKTAVRTRRGSTSAPSFGNVIRAKIIGYFSKLGFRVLAAAPANGNCNHFVKNLVLASEGVCEAPSEASADSGVHFGPKPPAPPKTGRANCSRDGLLFDLVQCFVQESRTTRCRKDLSQEAGLYKMSCLSRWTASGRYVRLY